LGKEDNHEKQGVEVRFLEGAESVSYSNVVLVNHSSEEFLFDFGTITPGREGVEVFSRIALSPRNAKLLLMVLGERLEGYEKQFGEIRLPGEG